MLQEYFEGLRKDAASGIDKVTKEEYSMELEANLSALVGRLNKMSYIPKAGSDKKRRLAILSLEDKLVQALFNPTYPYKV